MGVETLNNVFFTIKKTYAFIFQVIFLFIFFNFEESPSFLFLSLIVVPVVDKSLVVYDPYWKERRIPTTSKSLVVYDPYWSERLYESYQKMAFLKFSSCLIYILMIIFGLLIALLAFKIEYFVDVKTIINRDWWESASSQEMLPSIFEKVQQIFLYYYALPFIYFGMLAVLIPVLNRTYKLAFKKLFICSTTIFLFSFISFFSATQFPNNIYEVWWTKYLPLNYLYGEACVRSLAASLLTLSFFFWWFLIF